MREYLFRGMKTDGEWVYGGFAIDSIGCAVILTSEENILRHIHNHTLTEFTGLTDKNGIKIFEGDILKSDVFQSKKYFISFGKSKKCGQCFCVESYNSIAPLTITWSNTMEIIGNVFDNPELFEDHHKTKSITTN